ncbi:LysM peptidoglycan-binding domain-containing protein [Aminobacter sp. J44]|uniref:LysM peptidoglycan-binding domain-containing protein n=1 Tax=Aminobacter sp. J44 TaxID=935262 RepID=UPI00119C1635|nr:LysM peptidoglycan-binding domain-containing protein [Aminobacter sp. J44]TWG67626.1 nucleoid-associated protein YgaU [Aminobacter sp. J44]
MMPVWLKALLFVGGGVVAATGAAYVTGALDPWLGRQPASVAETSANQPAPQQPAKTEPQPEAQQPATETAKEPAEPQTTEKEARLPAPNFDVLRVEADGSVVVAGTAPAKAKVEVLHGDTQLAGTEANEGGEFVIVFDNPLAPGDYVLSLRATTPEGEVIESSETAVVSIPEKKDGQVLAMVQEPGAAAQLMAVPEAKKESEEPAAPAQAEESASSTDEPAVAASEEASPASEAPAAEQRTVAAAEDEAESDASAAEPDTDQSSTEQEVAAASPEPQSAPEPQPAQTGQVVVEAVEIEGDTIFVAGHADPGFTVRVYAGDILLGDSVSSKAGRFLVEAKRDLPVGSYVIRADLLARDGSVIARAAVPFEREAGETLSAVAMQQPSDSTAPSAAGQAAGSTDAADPSASGSDTQAAALDTQSGDLTAPALQRVDGSVIIRRGDSLWRISRRVYGRGVRYSTIYLANQDQIRNPNLIWPGQVFTVPQVTEEGEQADLDAIADQVVKPQ